MESLKYDHSMDMASDSSTYYSIIVVALHSILVHNIAEDEEQAQNDIPQPISK